MQKTVTKFKRFGKYITSVYLFREVVDKMDVDHFVERMEAYRRRKKVLLVDGFRERYLQEWFEEHFKEFGFEQILDRKHTKYAQLKKETDFYGFPDYLVKKDEKWFRLEVECFSESYQRHPKGYADFVLCYIVTAPVDGVNVLTVAEHLGYDEIIARHEVAEFLYLYDEEFRKQYDDLLESGVLTKRFSTREW